MYYNNQVLKLRDKKIWKKSYINNPNQGQSYASLIKRISSSGFISQH